MKKNMTYEQGMQRLEEIVRLLEAGEISLEESMKLFDEGTKLSAELGKKLDQAEQKVSLMQQKDDGTLIGVQMETEEEAWNSESSSSSTQE